MRFLPLMLALLAGCATALPTVDSLSPERVRDLCAVTRDDFKKVTRVVGPVIVFANTSDFTTGVVGSDYRFRIEAQRVDSKDPVYFVAILTQRNLEASWAFWNEAFDRNGNRFELVSDSREVGQVGGVFEVCSARVTREYLDGISKEGIEWALYGKRATSKFPITPSIVQGFLSKSDATFAK